jgi:hypothetical protein
MSFDTNKITVQYLANNIYCKQKNDDYINNFNYNMIDILFYKKRIIETFTKQLKGLNVNPEIDGIFNNYLNELIYNFTNSDKHEEYQKQYTNNNENNTIIQDTSTNDIIVQDTLTNDILVQDTSTNDIIVHDTSTNDIKCDTIKTLSYNNLKPINNKNTLDRFIINKKKNVDIIYPEIKKINIHTEYYKNKNKTISK